jgi:internalin A
VELNAAATDLSEIPDCVRELKNLTQLWLYSNQITTIPDGLGELKNLTTLVLDSNQITTIPDCVGELKNLTYLGLDSNQITTIPDCVGELKNLTYLGLDSNQITTIPDCIGKLRNLTELWLSSNQITTIPDCIGKLRNLTELALDSNQITTIPDCIGELKNLTYLGLSSNQITTIPDCVGELKNLTILGLDSNQITTIPNCVGELKNLTELGLSSNQITTIPDCVGELKNFITLGLDSNQITTIPDCVGELKNLTYLRLDSNQITTIPDCVGELKNLTHLRLDNNRITTIPDCVGELKNLTSLELDSNQITTIPDCVKELTQLEKLNLANNKITHCPAWLRDLPNLKTLDLRRNSLPISPEVLGPANLSEDPGSIEAIFNYLEKFDSGEVKPLDEAKLLLVGQGSVGKTSLINGLLGQPFNPNESQTDGLRVRQWPVHVNSKDVTLNVWDFGGQEVYHATHQFFLTKRSLYVLVCNCRTSEEENRIEYWLKLIQSFGGESPVIIVGNKNDEQPFDINRKALRQKYANICAILETSCQTGNGIDALREAITQEVGKLHDVYNLLPLPWFEVKEQLEALNRDLKRDFISYAEYIGICCQHHIVEEQDQTQLIDLLHNLGLVLNFREHSILQMTKVLNPDWVTAGIYQLLSDDTLKTEGKGILTYDDLSRVLNPERYPAERHRYLTDLMQQFQLCFELRDCPCPRFLIPGLLPKDEPDDISLEGDTLEFQYHYPVWQESVLSRFIVLSHEDIHQNIQWRSGVMLAYREGDEVYNIARIKADPEDKKIFIAISGRETTRRVFLSLIRDTFTTIHRSFTDLGVTEWVPVPDHPDHPPLDYQELLGLEGMGEPTVTIGKLRLRLNLRQLLDGYEPQADRQRQRYQQQGLDERDMMFRRFYDELDGMEREPSIPKPRSGAVNPRPKKTANSRPAPNPVPVKKEVYISYAWGGESEAITNQIDAAFQCQDITLIRDKSELGYKGNIKAFMEQIGRGKAVIVMISDKYLKSENCMFELVEIAAKGEFYDRIFPIVLPDADIYKPVKRLQYIQHWENEIDELEKALKTVSAANMQGFRESIDLYTRIRATLAELVETLKNMNTLTPERHTDSAFAELFEAVRKRLE